MALTNSEWIQLSFGVTLAAKFAIISREPGVEHETRALRQRLNIDNVFRHLALRIGALVGRAGNGNKQKDIFFHYEQRVRKIQRWYERMIKATGASNAPPNAQPPPSTASTTPAVARQPELATQPHDQSSEMPAVSHFPTSVAFLPQHPQGYAQPNIFQNEHDTTAQHQTAYQIPETYDQSVYHAPVADVGMTPLHTYTTQGSSPSIAYMDLMNAQGWDNMFAIPMEHDALIFDVNQGYGLGMASPPSDGSTWDSPSA